MPQRPFNPGDELSDAAHSHVYEKLREAIAAAKLADWQGSYSDHYEYLKEMLDTCHGFEEAHGLLPWQRGRGEDDERR